MDRLVEMGVKTSLWVDGRSTPATLLWISNTHAELITDEANRLAGERLTALVVRDFMSLPSRVEAKQGRLVVLRFVQPPHSSVIDLLRSELVDVETELARDEMEENAVPDCGVDFFDEETDAPSARAA